MTYILGIDAGATKTFALVADGEGRLLGFGRGGPGNHQGRGLDVAMASVETAAREALGAAGVAPDDVAIVSCGLAGADLPEDFEMLQPALEGLGLGRRVDLRNDTQVAMRAGTHQPWGVVVICGTGFNAAARAPDGREIRWPGLGPISGDSSGGSSIALEMVRMVMRAADGREPPTLLTELVLDALEQPSPYELMRAMYHHRIERRRVNQLVPLVFQAALRNDQVAQTILIREGEEIGTSAAALITKLDMQELPVEVVLGGSVFKGEGPLFLDTIRQRVHRTAPAAVLVRPSFEPVVGAVLLGLDAVGVTATDALYSTLRATMPSLGQL